MMLALWSLLRICSKYWATTNFYSSLFVYNLYHLIRISTVLFSTRTHTCTHTRSNRSAIGHSPHKSVVVYVRILTSMHAHNRPLQCINELRCSVHTLFVLSFMCLPIVFFLVCVNVLSRLPSMHMIRSALSFVWWSAYPIRRHDRQLYRTQLLVDSIIVYQNIGFDGQSSGLYNTGSSPGKWMHPF